MQNMKINSQPALTALVSGQKRAKSEKTHSAFKTWSLLIFLVAGKKY